MRKIIFILIFLSPPFLKNCFLRLFCKAKIGRGVYIGWFSSIKGRSIEIGDYSRICSFSMIKCDSEVKIGKYSTVSNFVVIYGNSSFILGNQSYIGPQCWLNADEDIRIGNISALGPRCMIFTHGSFLPYTEGYWVKLASVSIGNYVYIGASVFIHSGVEIGNNVFVNAMSVVKENIPSGEIAEGFPAKPVMAMDKVKRAMTPERLDAVLRQILLHFTEVVLQRKMGIQVHSNITDYLSFCYRNKEYTILLIATNYSNSLLKKVDYKKRIIFLVTRDNWTPPKTFKNPKVFDLINKRMCFCKDKIYLELYLFMKRFYGVQLEYDNRR